MTLIDGSNGQVEFNGHTVRIGRDGFAGGASHLAPEAIPIGAITAVTVHAPRDRARLHPLSQHRQHRPTNYMAAAKDGRTLLFKKSADQIEQLRTAVQAAIDAR